MKKKYLSAIALFVLCFSFVLLGKSVSAAEEVNVNTIAYVDGSNLVLKFGDFCSTGYTYQVTNASGSSVGSGSLEANQGNLSVALGNNYQKGQMYKLVLTGKDSKNQLTVNYYTGTALTASAVTENTDDSLKVSWNSSDTTTYSGYRIAVSTEKDSASTTTSVQAGAKDTEKSISASSLSNATYYTYVIGYKTVGNVNYYGQGYVKTCDYVKTPSKVTGVTATPAANRVTLSWTAVKDASSYTVYQSSKKKGGYTAVKTGCTATTVTIKNLTAGKKYYFKVTATARLGSKTKTGSRSSAAVATVPVVAGKVKGVKFTATSDGQLALTWNRTKNATGYRIFYKKTTETAYKKLGSTKKKTFSLEKLDPDTSYDLKVCAYTKIGSVKYLSSKKSKKVTVTPGTYTSKSLSKILASKVRTIGFSGSKTIYTTKKYTTATKEAFVNYKGYTSKSKYLIWVSQYTQQVSIFKKKKGRWKMIDTFLCATGKAGTPSPRGVFKLGYKESGWYYTSTKVLYVSHYCGKNSFHTRILWNSGAVKTATIGKPASHGCFRLYNKDAKYIHDKMPVGTTVVSY